MGQMLDIVPNHMGVLERRQRLVAGRAGERPRLAACRDFDIDWQPLSPS
jgi:maltooligosyltrehalose synthase